MIFIRFGLLFLLVFRTLALIPRLRQRFGGDPASAEVDGVAVPFQYRVGRNSKSKLVTDIQLGLQVPDRVRFRIQRETAFDRFAKVIGIAHEWQTDDRTFDTKVYVLSDDAVLLTALSRNPALRGALMALLDAPSVEVIRCSYGVVWIEADCSGKPNVPDVDVAREFAKGMLPRLARVREELKSIGSGMWEASRDPGLRRQNVLLAITLVLGALGFAAFLWPRGVGLPRQLVVDEITTHALQLSGVACATLAFAAWALMGRRSRLHWVMLELLLVGAPGVWFIAAAASEQQNQRYDVSRSETREVHVDRQYMEKGSKGRKHYYLSISDWPDARVSPTQQVPDWLYGEFHAPGCAHVVWHAGSLGDPWISELSPSTCGDLED